MADNVAPMYDFSPFADLLPEGAVPMYGYLVVVYVDPETGKVEDEYGVIGASTLRDALGTLESMKLRLVDDQYERLSDG